MGKYYSEHELLNNMYDIVDEDGCILTVLDEDTLKSLPPLMPVRQPVHAHWRERPISRFYDLVNYQMTRLKPCECSRCGCPCGNELMRYCPTCGAKMDEEEGQR